LFREPARSQTYTALFNQPTVNTTTVATLAISDNPPGFKVEESVGRVWFDQFVSLSESAEMKLVFKEIVAGHIDRYRQHGNARLRYKSRDKHRLSLPNPGISL